MRAAPKQRKNTFLSSQKNAAGMRGGGGGVGGKQIVRGRGGGGITGSRVKREMLREGDRKMRRRECCSV